MKKFLILISIVFSAKQSMGQCQFMSERDFESSKYRLSGNRGNINTFQAAMDLSRAYCLSSNQARELANYLANDRDKFDFLKSTFPNITDKENYTNVLDVFRLFSSAIRLYHETLGAGRSLQPNLPTSGLNPNCPRPMDQSSFSQIRTQILMQNEDRQRAAAILNVAQQCMTTQQISNIIMNIQDENIRLDVLKRLQPFVYDVENYGQAANTLSATYKTQFLAFLQNPNATHSNPSGSGQTNAVSEIDFNNFINAIKKQSFEKDRENYIKTYMKNAHLNVKQIQQVIKTLSFDATKLELAKFLYDRCIDKQNYFQVTNELQFSSSKTELNEFIKARQ